MSKSLDVAALSLAFLAMLWSAAPVSALPPLTEQQQMRLETARDGRDYREEAFFALVENVQLWTGDLGDTPVRLQIDVAQLIADPDAFRGDVMRVTGRLEQRTKLEQEYGGAEEWFVRGRDGAPVLVYAVGVDANDSWREGHHVELFGRFYKRVDAVDRQGREQQYAAFVAVHPRIVRAETAGGIVQLWVVAVPVAALLIGFAFLLLFVRRQRGRPRQFRRSFAISPELEEPRPLPDDPADALAELRRRAMQRDDVARSNRAD